jgi:hypothetical protein
MEQNLCGDPPTVEAWTTAMTNWPPEQALQFRDHAVRSLKNDSRWREHVNVAERILRERGISWE